MSETTLTPDQVRRLDKLARECPRCDAWLGQLLQAGILRKPKTEKSHGK